MAAPPAKRFKFTSQHEQLSRIKVTTKVAVSLEEPDDEDIHSTALSSTLSRLALHDLTTRFTALSSSISPLATSLPVILHNLDRIISELLTFINDTRGDSTGLESALALLSVLYETTLAEALAYTVDVTSAICRVGTLTSLEARLVQSSFNTLASVFRAIAPFLLKSPLLEPAWLAILPYCKHDKPHVRKCAAEAWAVVVRKARAELPLLLEIMCDNASAEVWTCSMLATPTTLHSRAEALFTTLLARNDPLLPEVLPALPCAAPLVSAVVAGTATSPDYALRLLAVVTASRKRFPRKLVRPALNQLATLPLDRVDNMLYLTALAGLLAVGELADWLNPGVKLIAAVWEQLRPSMALSLVDLLVNWPGVEQFIIPHVSRSAPAFLVAEPAMTLAALNSLACAGHLKPHERWHALTTPMIKLLDADLHTACQVLSLIPHIGESHRFADAITIATTRAAVVDCRADWVLSPWNTAHHLGQLLGCAYALAADVSSLIPSLATTCAWNREIIGHVAAFTERHMLQYDAAPLLPNLLSADGDLRHATLRILAVVDPNATWQLCLDVERADLSLKNTRDRTTHIGRLGRFLLDSTDLRAIPYVVAQLKVNYRPLYSETVKALAALASKCPDLVWAVIWEQLQQTLSASQQHLRDIGVDEPSWAGQSDQVVVLQLGGSRLDVLNYESQLLAVLSATPALAEKHSRRLVPAFLNVIESTSGQFTTRQRQQRTCAFLQLFAKFVNPKACYLSSDLYVAYLRLLAKGDNTIQSRALDCILTYRQLESYRDRLTKLLDDATFRDELSRLDLTVIDAVDRPSLVPVVIRLLYGVLTSRRASARSHTQAILGALSGCDAAELGLLVDLMLEPIDGDATGHRQLGFLSLLPDVLRYLGMQLGEHWLRLLETTIALVKNAHERINSGLDSALPLRAIRAAGAKRLVQFVRDSNLVDQPLPVQVLCDIIASRLDKLETENTQAPSATLDLIYELAVIDPAVVAFALPNTLACLTANNVKPSVILRVFDIVEAVLQDASLLPLDAFLAKAGQIAPSADPAVLERLLSILPRLTVTNGIQAQSLASVLGPLIKTTPGRSKVDLLNTLRHLYAISPDLTVDSSFRRQAYSLVSNLFQRLHHPAARRALVSVFQTFHTPSSDLIADLNAYSAKRLDEPDFDRRLAAFARVNDGELVVDWLPVVRCAFYFVQDADELAIRASASALLQRYISSSDKPEDFFLPSLRHIFRHKSEAVRNEGLAVLSHAVRTYRTDEFTELRPLLAEDDEANVFVNMGHIQVHRRARALRRLCDHVADIRPSTVTTIFIPIVEHYLAGAADVTDHHLVNEAIATIGVLSSRLNWTQYSALLLRLLRVGLRHHVRAVSAVIDNFALDADVDVNNVPFKDDDNDSMSDANIAPSESDDAVSGSARLVRSAIATRVLPALDKYVKDRDVDEKLRIPLTLGMVKLAHVTGSDEQVLSVITTAAQVLRSKDQNIRDTSRETLSKIASYLGPEWLPRLFNELQTALQRGPQKHVLAVTVHSILMSTADLVDDAVETAASLSAEVIWGQSGADTESEGFQSKMREVRGAKSRAYDTYQLLARLVSPAKLAALLLPCRQILHTSQAVGSLSQVDEVLRRIAIGLNDNQRIASTDLLALCHSLITGNTRFLSTNGSYAQNSYKFVAFGLDLFVTAFRRGRFDFDNVEVLKRLGPLVPAIGNTLYSTSPAIVLGLKAAAAIARCPVPQAAEALPALVTNIFRLLKHGGDSQAAFKTLAVLIRDCNAVLSDYQLEQLLELVAPDLEDHDRQSAAFTLLRAIVSRRFVVPAVYELMDRISTVAVTSQSTHAQSAARGVLVQFLLDYPHGTNRMRAHMTFFARNLDYAFESGRLSVMELLRAVFAKFADDALQEYAHLYFVALTVVMANDESTKCRETAGELICQLFKRVDGSDLLDVMDAWVGNHADNPSLASAALKVYAILDVNRRPAVGKVLVDTVRDTSLALSALEFVAARPSPEDPWEDIVDHLSYPHAWVRFAAVRALSSSLPSVSQDILFLAVKHCCASADTDMAGTAADAVVTLLVNIASRWANEDDGLGENRPLPWLMSRLSFIARQAVIDHTIGTSLSVLRIFHGIMRVLKVDQARTFLIHMLSPIYRILEGGDLDGVDEGETEALRTLAAELRDGVQTSVGVTAFTRAWDAQRQRVGDKRQTRRVERARLAVADPIKWAQRKGKREMAKKESRKKKVKSHR